ncbi:hypothetical protein QBL07_000470 (plasmid) [Gordonia rubripertincta]|uniref:Glycine zipper domain-containing protein n=1 Tax=Gordonia rubripertincta TaxID=36822 RepID=A0AAW6RAQ5_GORRU|nr:hypothetical protein [Gordonia rubripertincta]MCZ4537501.1 hypothetical protein [Gordonia terrae]MDG6783008.1 hypothetical protein [Gordonia rubripertincta]
MTAKHRPRDGHTFTSHRMIAAAVVAGTLATGFAAGPALAEPEQGGTGQSTPEQGGTTSTPQTPEQGGTSTPAPTPRVTEPGPGFIPSPPQEAPYQPYVAPQTYSEPTYERPYTPTPPQAFTAPKPTRPVAPIAPPPEMMRVGNYVVPVEDVKKQVPGITQAQINSVNEWSAYGEAKIAQGLISVGVPEDEASRQAAATIIGVMGGGTAGALVLGVPAAVVGGLGGAAIGAGIGFGVGSFPAPGPQTPGAVAIGAGIGAAAGAAALGIPAAVVGGVAGGTVGGLLAHALGAGDPGANPAQPRLPGQPAPQPRTAPQPAPTGPNQFEVRLAAPDAARAGLPAVDYQVNVRGDVSASVDVAGQTVRAGWSGEQAQAPYNALGAGGAKAQETVRQWTEQATDQLSKAVPGLHVAWPGQQKTPAHR